MADPTTANGQDALEEQLSRLLRKPGVRAVIVLDRGTGAIVKTSGQFDAIKALASPKPATTSFSEEGASPETESIGIGQFAAMIWTWVKTSETLIQDLDPEDEGRLLRLRTKKKELVVVPDAKISQCTSTLHITASGSLARRSSTIVIGAHELGVVDMIELVVLKQHYEAFRTIPSIMNLRDV